MWQATLPAILALAPISIPTADVDLRVRLEPGKSIPYTFKQEVSSEVDLAGTKLVTGIVMDQELEIHCIEELEDGARALEIRFGHVRGKIEMPMFNGEFDSRVEGAQHNPLLAPMIETLTLMDGNKVTLTLSELGEVRDLKGYVDVFEGTEVLAWHAANGSPISNETFEKTVQSFFALLPREPVGSGSQWEGARSFTIVDNDVEFRPRSACIRVTEEELEWNFGTVGDLTKQDPKLIEAKSGEGTLGFVSESMRVKDATLLGATVVSIADGLPIRQTLETAVQLDFPNPTGGEGYLPLATTERITIERRKP